MPTSIPTCRTRAGARPRSAASAKTRLFSPKRKTLMFNGYAPGRFPLHRDGLAGQLLSVARDVPRFCLRPRKQRSAAAVGRFKPVLFLMGVFPLARWIWLGTHNGLTANPVEFLTRSAGTWTFVCLLVTLAITPLRRLDRPTRAGAPAPHVRSFLPSSTAFCTLCPGVAWDRGLDLASMLQDVRERPFITVGFAAFVLMHGPGGHLHPGGHAAHGQALAARCTARCT